MVSVTYGVGVHARSGCDPAWPEKRLKPSLEAFLRAAALNVGEIGALQNFDRTIVSFDKSRSLGRIR